MLLKKQLIREVKERFGVIPIIVEIYRMIMKAVSLIFNFVIAFIGVVLWKLGAFLSSVILICGSALIYILVLKDHSEDRIYEWSAKTHHSAEHLLITTVVLYFLVVIVQFLLLFLPKIISI